MCTRTTEPQFNSSATENISNLLNKYCDYNKFFLVEELALEEDYTQLHYGRCTVIGKLRENEHGLFELENIRLPNIPSEYSLPEGTLSIRLLTFNYRDNKLQNGRFCQVYGEVVILNVRNPTRNRIPLTSRGLQEQLVLVNGQQRERLLTNFLETHKPAIRLWHLNEIDRAGDLAERNLEIRMLSERRKA